MYRDIRDYALIGDCHTAALVSSEGSLDWLCLPEFDSPAIFLRLLDDQRGGSCTIQPQGTQQVSRRYLPATNILETTFHTASGTLLLTDFMPVRRRDRSTREGQDCDAEHRIVRLLQCTSGEVELTIVVRPTFSYANEDAQLTPESPSAVLARGKEQGLQVQIVGQELHPQADASMLARFRLRAGESAALVLSAAGERPSPIDMDMGEVHEALARTRSYWKQWASGFDYVGEFRDELLRSALVLKLMTFEPTGAIVAAPTTSLPEAIGGERNWDYRFTWLRDATFTLIALMNLGYFGEARDFLHFVKRTVGPQEKFQILYTIRGGRKAHEHDLAHLDGYRSSRPVRVGNGAVDQTQPDIFGELIHCVYLYVAHPETDVSARAFAEEFWPLVNACADLVCAHWRDPDHGIWEMRGQPRQFVYSKGSCWLALDRAIRLAQHFRLPANCTRFQRERDALHDSFIRRGFDPQVDAFVQTYGSKHLDASTLRLPIMGVIDARDPRMLATVAQVEQHLMRNGLVYRYRRDDGLHGEEGAFTACGFWLVDNYVLSGRLEDARRLFRHLLSFANDVGLLSEEIHPDSSALLGNFPQAFTHIALINAGIRLAEARHGRKPTAHAISEEGTSLPQSKVA